MTPARLHDQAMDLFNEAIFLQEQGQDAFKKFIEAYELETKAAYAVAKDPKNEPSRSMLFLGAATIAMRLDKFEEAKKLVAEGLLGSPTPKTLTDLKELLQTIEKCLSQKYPVRGTTWLSQKTRLEPRRIDFEKIKAVAKSVVFPKYPYCYGDCENCSHALPPKAEKPFNGKKFIAAVKAALDRNPIEALLR